MTRIIRKPARFLFAAAMLGSLAFGATQAFADPIRPVDPYPVEYCTDSNCGYNYYTGKCECW